MTIVIVDDDPGMCRSLERMIRSYGFEAKAFSSAEAYLVSGHVNNTTCLILDLRMPGMNGLDLQTQLRAEGRRFPIIFITGYLDDEVREKALLGGAIDILEKPFDSHVLIKKIDEALIRQACS